MKKAGRDMSELQSAGLVFPLFTDPNKPADLARSIETSVPPQLEKGIDSLTIKPSQFIDNPDEMPAFLAEVDRRVEALVNC